MKKLFLPIFIIIPLLFGCSAPRNIYILSTSIVSSTSTPTETVTPAIEVSKIATETQTATATQTATEALKVITEADWNGVHFKYDKVEVSSVISDSEIGGTPYNLEHTDVNIYFYTNKVDVFPSVNFILGARIKAVYYDGDKRYVVDNTTGLGKPGVGVVTTSSKGVPKKIGCMIITLLPPEKIVSKNVRLASVQIARVQGQKLTTLYSDGSERLPEQ